MVEDGDVPQDEAAEEVEKFAGDYFDPLVVISTITTAMYDLKDCELVQEIRDKMYFDFQRTIYLSNKCIQKALEADLQWYKDAKK